VGVLKLFERFLKLLGNDDLVEGGESATRLFLHSSLKAAFLSGVFPAARGKVSLRSKS
jgi:hypothetical protein